ncbi:TerB N-terminal domain-containing protein [Polyangium sp. 15x6]|uniref:tellurite resistance TerB family protein n=1 Tax=Polyangium sp. 15x6 TaxID=3042687 RepID=UPI00249A7B60|nr:TerB N-terminal domain-containing protein [Polyangium sp. 15x6]
MTSLGVTPTVRGSRVPVGLEGIYVALSPYGFVYRANVETVPDGAPPIPLVALPVISSEQSLRVLEQIAERSDLFRVYWIGSLILVLLLLPAAPIVALFLAIALAIGGVLVRPWNDERRTARLLYDVDDPAAMDRFGLACTVGEALGACGALWLVSSAVSTDDLRRNAGAGTLVNRMRVHCMRNAVPVIETNLEAWSLFMGPQTLTFLPDSLLIHQGGRFTAFSYAQLSAHVEVTSFVEEAVPLPPDAHVIRSTWRYVCKDGTPDLRFSNNVQHPVVQYGQLRIRSSQGLDIVLQASRTAAAEQAAAALNMLSNLARTGSPTTSQQPTSVAPPAVAPSSRRERGASSVAPTIAMHAVPEAPRAILPPMPPPAVTSIPARAPVPLPPPPPVAAPEPSRSPADQALLAVQAMARAATPVVTPPTPAPAAARVTAGEASWIPPGQTITIAGYTIDSGMLYVGANLTTVSGYLRGVEPALVNPRLAVDALPNRTGDGMPYWPSYSEIRPADRAAYLEWLSGGRRAKNTYIGYVFLFFYGLERRILADGQRHPLPPEERSAILVEVRRLLSIYGSNNSFRRYASDFLAVAEISHGAARSYAKIPVHISPGAEYPLSIRLGLGQLAADGVPVPAEWAYLWTLFDPETRLGVVAQRCPDELRKLFLLRYEGSFGKGIVLDKRGRDIAVRYKPASASFGGEINIPVEGVPDVAERSAPRLELRELLWRCAAELDALSRWLGRNPNGRGSLAALALLPPELATSAEGGELATLCEAIRRRLGSNPSATMPTKEILRGKRTKADFVTVAQLLQRRGYGLEPDVRFGGPLPDAEGSVVVFNLPTDAPTSPSPEYHAVALLMHLATVIAAADDDVSETEEKQLRMHLEDAMHLSQGERARVDAHVQWLLRERPGLAGVKKRLAALDSDKRGKIADFVVAVACADGRVTPAEVKALVKMAPMLGMDEAAVYRRIHALSAAATPAADEPVTVKPSEPGRGYAIPQSPAAAAGEIRIDMARVGKLMEDTKNVAIMLDKIFVAEEDAPPAPPPPPPSGATIGSLGPQESEFLRRLAERASWARGEVETLAAELGLMPDGALEAINDAAFEVSGAPVCSGDDPLELDQDIVKEMLR